jgi:hypothetical protein
VTVHGTGVLIRLATADEVDAAERARRGLGFELEPPRSFRGVAPERPPGEGEAYVVGQAFVEFDEQRWTSAEHHGWHVPVANDATMELLELAEEVARDGLIDLLGDMRIAGLGVSRRELMSAPRRIDLAPELNARLAPLKRG